MGQGFGAGSGAARCGLRSPLVLDLQRSWCDLCAWFGGALLCFSPPFEMVKSGEARPLPHCPPQLFPKISYVVFPAFLAARNSLKATEQRSGKLRAVRIPHKTHRSARAHCWGAAAAASARAEPPGWTLSSCAGERGQHTQTCRGLAAASPEHRGCLQYLTTTSQSCFAGTVISVEGQ